MRVLESLLLALFLLVALATVLRLQASRRLATAGAATALLLFALHAVWEGTRWQMLPAYTLLLLMLARLVWRANRGREDASRTRRRLLRRLLAGTVPFVLLPLATLLALFLPASMPVPQLPSPTGPHAVGTSVFAVEFGDRPEILTPEEGDHRELLVRVWYPASVPSGANPDAYMSEVELAAFQAVVGRLTPGAGLLYSHAALAETHSYRDVELASTSGPLPVLVFSHGYGSVASQNTALMEELASHGYVVFALSHLYDGSAVFPDGRVTGLGDHVTAWAERAMKNVEQTLQQITTLVSEQDQDVRRAQVRAFEEQTRQERSEGLGVGVSWQVWSEDQRRFLDVLAELQAGDGSSRFTGRLDLDRVALFGMSFGGAVAVEVCHLDPRCKAAINLDGGHFYAVDSPLFDGDSARPLLMVYSSQLTTHSTPTPGNPGDFQAYNDFHYERVTTRGSREDIVRIRVEGTSHLHLSDMSLMVRFLPGIASETPGARIAEILNRYCLAFFDRHLRGRPAPLLEGPTPDIPEVSFQSFGRALGVRSSSS